MILDELEQWYEIVRLARQFKREDLFRLNGINPPIKEVLHDAFCTTVDGIVCQTREMYDKLVAVNKELHQARLNLVIAEERGDDDEVKELLALVGELLRRQQDLRPALS